MNLHGFIGALYRHFSGIQLGHGRFQSGLHACVFHGGSAHGEQPRRIDLGGHVRQLPLYGLKFADAFSKLLALFGILQRRFIGPLRHTQPQRCNRDASAIQDTHGIDEAITFFAQQGIGGHPAIFKNQL